MHSQPARQILDASELNVMHRFRLPVLLVTALLMPLQSGADELEVCEPMPSPFIAKTPKFPLLETYSPVEGFAVVEFTITESGIVTDAVLIESGSTPDSPRFTTGFGLSALDAVVAWKYETRQSKCRARQRVLFELDSGDDA